MPTAPAVIFMTSNGVGMGHLSRQLTTALSGPPRFAGVVFSLSKALPRIMAADADGELPEATERGLRYEYCPSWESGWFPQHGLRAAARRQFRSYRWDPYLRDRIIALAAETEATALVFDGVMPYRGLLDAREALPELKFAWVRRGMWQADTPEQRLDASQHFDLTIEPGDYAADADRGPTAGRTDAQRVAPISLTDVLDALPKHKARAALGLPEDGPALLLAPGSGALGSVDETSREVLKTVRALAPEWTVAVTRQTIAKHGVGSDDDGVTVLDDVYPLVRYLSAFDAAVGAAGYNAVHELVSARIPSVFVPSTNHVTDDQVARAEGIEARDAAIAVGSGDLYQAVEQLLDADVRARLRTGCAALEAPTGGADAAALVSELASDGSPTGHGLDFPRPPRPLIDLRTPATPSSPTSIIATEELDTSTARGEHPVEHLLAGSSPEYRQVRKQISSWIYSAR